MGTFMDAICSRSFGWDWCAGIVPATEDTAAMGRVIKMRKNLVHGMVLLETGSAICGLDPLTTCRNMPMCFEHVGGFPCTRTTLLLAVETAVGA